MSFTPCWWWLFKSSQIIIIIIINNLRVEPFLIDLSSFGINSGSLGDGLIFKSRSKSPSSVVLCLLVSTGWINIQETSTWQLVTFCYYCIDDSVCVCAYVYPYVCFCRVQSLLWWCMNELILVHQAEILSIWCAGMSLFHWLLILIMLTHPETSWHRLCLPLHSQTFLPVLWNFPAPVIPPLSTSGPHCFLCCHMISHLPAHLLSIGH